MSMGNKPRPAIEAPANEPPDLRGEKAGLICYLLGFLVYKLPREYGPAWLSGELAAAGIPIEWDSKAERFVAKPLIGAVKP